MGWTQGHTDYPGHLHQPSSTSPRALHTMLRLRDWKVDVCRDCTYVIHKVNGTRFCNFESITKRIVSHLQFLWRGNPILPDELHLTMMVAMAAVGARIRRGCMFRHVSVEDGDWKDDSWERNLVSVGYQGTRPSVWAMQVCFRSIL